MNFWTAESIKAATGSVGGTWLARPEGVDLSTVMGVSIDSRTIRTGQVFVAIRGERFDGHDYLASAIEGGSPLLIVERDALPRGGVGGNGGGWGRAHVLKVTDTRKALLKLAAAYRDALKTTRVVAVCGSNGKTTTTALIHAVLGTKLRGTASAKSFNNDIGVPLTVLSAKPNDQYLLCEMGSNAPGEIAALAEVVRPDIAVITSIGREHLMGFGTIEGVAREEAAVLKHLHPASAMGGGTAVVTADTPLLAEHLKGIKTVVTFGRSPTAELRLTAFDHFSSSEGKERDAGTSDGRNSEPIADSVRFTVNGRSTFTLAMVGEHNALNALAAIGVARRLGLSDDDIAAGLLRAKPPDMRMTQAVVRGIRVVNDAYNANPDSTLAALRTFAAIHAGADRRVVVLGDNLELGDHADEAHREIGQTILELGCIDLLVTVGPLAAIAAGVIDGDWAPSRIVKLPDVEEGRAAAVAAILREGDAVLLKGSRRMGLERILKALATVAAPVRA